MQNSNTTVKYLVAHCMYESTTFLAARKLSPLCHIQSSSWDHLVCYGILEMEALSMGVKRLSLNILICLIPFKASMHTHIQACMDTNIQNSYTPSATWSL